MTHPRGAWAYRAEHSVLPFVDGLLPHGAESEVPMNNQQNDRNRQPGDKDTSKDGQREQQQDRSGQQGEDRDRNRGGSQNQQD